MPVPEDPEVGPRVRPPQDYSAAEIAAAQGDWRAVLELNGAEPAPARVAGFLRIYARIIRRQERWDIPETMANAYESAATALDQYQAEVAAQLTDLRGERDALHAEVEALRRARDKRIGLMMQLGQILGPDYDGVTLEEVVREFVALRGADAALQLTVAEIDAVLCNEPCAAYRSARERLLALREQLTSSRSQPSGE